MPPSDNSLIGATTIPRRREPHEAGKNLPYFGKWIGFVIHRMFDIQPLEHANLHVCFSGERFQNRSTGEHNFPSLTVRLHGAFKATKLPLDGVTNCTFADGTLETCLLLNSPQLKCRRQFV